MVAQELLFPTELGLGLGFGLNPSLFEAQQPPDRAGDIHPSFSFFSFLFFSGPLQSFYGITVISCSQPGLK
jgi:hypothetical protein